MLVVYAEGGSFPDGLIIQSAFFTAIYWFFMTGRSDDPSSCLASTDDDPIQEYPLVEDQGVLSLVDVAYRYHLFFEALFYISAAQTICGILTRVINGYDLTRLLFNIYHLSQLAMMVVWIAGFLFRFSHSGRVCSGDLADSYDGDLYLVQQGFFILVMGIIVFLVFGLGFLNGIYRKITGKDTL